MLNSNRLLSPESITDIRQRLAEFDAAIVEHRVQAEIEAAILDEIRFPSKYNIILVMGATGVGKTTLMERIRRDLVRFSLTDPEFLADAGRIAVGVVHLEIVAGMPFVWKKYLRDSLIAFDEPLPDHKVSYDTIRVRTGEEEYIVLKKRDASLAYHEAFVNTLTFRSPYAFLNDDGQYLTKIRSGGDLIDQMDTIKTLADGSNTTFVFFGTHEMHFLISLNEQLDRRTLPILYPRYREENPEDLATYKDIVATLRGILPIAKKPNLVGRYKWLFQRSLGCVGMLKDWLSATLKRYLMPYNSKEFLEICEELALSDERLQNRLSLITQSEKAAGAKLNQLFSRRGEANLGGSTLPNRNTKPGERKPSRDPVGIK